VTESIERKNNGSAARFYGKRREISTLLLLFVVLVGLPIVGVPRLRNRLSERILIMKAAVAGEVRPVVARVGANPKPFPAEYENPEPPIPRLPAVPSVQSAPAAPTAEFVPPSSDKSYGKVVRIVERDGDDPLVIMDGASRPPAESSPGISEESALKYQKGEEEQKAYDLLMKTNLKLAEMVQGSNPSLRFESWDAAHRGEDTYWVRLKFQSDDNPAMEYIWEVRLISKEITPLSYYARSIS
jgi:hypothetical protein